MTNRERYDDVFLQCFKLEKEKLNEALVYQSVAAWDSVGHMAMVAALESAFDIMMDTEDVIDFSSYHKGMMILAKYGVVF